MSNRWEMDYSWQYGHDPDSHGYDLRADVEAHAVASRTLDELIDESRSAATDPADRVLGSGGAFARFDEQGRLLLTSHGQDACDSLSFLADDIVERAEQIDPGVRLTWTQLAPRPDDGGPPTVRVGDEWVPADRAREQ